MKYGLPPLTPSLYMWVAKACRINICLALAASFIFSMVNNDERHSLKRELERLEAVQTAYFDNDAVDVSTVKLRDFKKDVLPANELPTQPDTIGVMPGKEKIKPQLQEDLEQTMGKRYEAMQSLAKRAPDPSANMIIQFPPPPSPLPIPNELGFPPLGGQVAEIKASLYLPLQKIFSPVTLKLTTVDRHLALYGAGHCEFVDNQDVLMRACIFRDSFDLAPDGKATAYEIDLSKTIHYALNLQFTPWARFSTSYLSCKDPAAYRMSVQFGQTKPETQVSIRLPYSTDQVDALADLNKKSGHPCHGLDLFLSVDDAMKLLAAVDSARQQVIGETRKDSENFWQLNGTR